MMDHFLEEVVIKKNRTLENILYILCNVLMVVCALLAVFWLNVLMNAGFHWMTVVSLLVMAGIAVGLFFYEYTFTNGDLDFAIVYNNQKRKTLGTMRVKNVEAFGPVNSEGFRKLINMPELKRKNWFLNRGANLYYFYFQKENNRTVIVLEPSEEMVGLIKKYLPVGAWRA